MARARGQAEGMHFADPLDNLAFAIFMRALDDVKLERLALPGSKSGKWQRIERAYIEADATIWLLNGLLADLLCDWIPYRLKWDTGPIDPVRLVRALKG